MNTVKKLALLMPFTLLATFANAADITDTTGSMTCQNYPGYVEPSYMIYNK